MRIKYTALSQINNPEQWQDKDIHEFFKERGVEYLPGAENQEQLDHLILVDMEDRSGFALFAAKPIKKGQKICSYYGENIPPSFQFVTPAKLAKNTEYVINTGIDATRKGSIGRFAQHLPLSKEWVENGDYTLNDPQQLKDLATQNITITADGDFIALQNINAREPIGFDYFPAFWAIQQKAPFWYTRTGKPVQYKNNLITFFYVQDEKYPRWGTIRAQDFLAGKFNNPVILSVLLEKNTEEPAYLFLNPLFLQKKLKANPECQGVFIIDSFKIEAYGNFPFILVENSDGMNLSNNETQELCWILIKKTNKYLSQINEKVKQDKDGVLLEELKTCSIAQWNNLFNFNIDSSLEKKPAFLTCIRNVIRGIFTILEKFNQDNNAIDNFLNELFPADSYHGFFHYILKNEAPFLTTINAEISAKTNKSYLDHILSFSMQKMQAAHPPSYTEQYGKKPMPFQNS